ncbi:MAG: spermidine/putrescine ABC transporter substrate-binding protein [Ardenticatenales bacterium]|nr:spermidine/putrescine ABC transporter substrate-binding protein [Ardenticatenales bacterium]
MRLRLHSFRLTSGHFAACLVLLLLSVGVMGCQGLGAATPTPVPAPPETLVFYYWEDYLPQDILDAFEQEYGIKVEYISYATSEEAVEKIRAEAGYDVVAIENFKIPTLIAEKKLAPIAYANVPNFRNISASFRDLSHDPGNQYSVPFNWGITGIVVRTDLLEEPITRWADLWDPRYQGRVGIWPLHRDMLGMALKTLGYSVNSENPAEVEEALTYLLELRKNAFLIDLELPHAASYLLDGEAVAVYGWAYDYQEARVGNEDVSFVIPEEGTLLWGEGLVIPAHSPNKQAAELFIDFLLRPEISAQLVNEVSIANANEAARPFIDPEILSDRSIFPPEEVLQNAESLLPLSPEAQALYTNAWQRFLVGAPAPEEE